MADRVAVFVDAGYLFAQGSTALTGSKQSRSLLTLNHEAVVRALIEAAALLTQNQPLLRIYWYDGVLLHSSGQTGDHAILAHTDNVKIRLGSINSQGQQKGVDSLIVTDMIDLARNGAMADAVLLSGDEDVRVAVQVAQAYGVRVHLLGIVPSRGSQSKSLLQEADTTTEWDAKVIGKFLSLRETREAPLPPPAKAKLKADVEISQELKAVVEALVATLTKPEIIGIIAFQESNRGVPKEYDGKMLANGRAALDRDLSLEEKRQVRRLFLSLVAALKNSNGAGEKQGKAPPVKRRPSGDPA